MYKTLILAIGGAGCNMAEYCKRNASSEGLKNANFIFADTDLDNITRLDKEKCQTLTLHPNSSAIPFTIPTGVENIVILAGLGGKTGSHFIGLAAKVAQSKSVKNMSLIVTMPFLFEGDEEVTKASETLKSLSSFYVRTLNNEDLVARYPNLNFINAFEHSDKEVLKAIERIEEL